MKISKFINKIQNINKGKYTKMNEITKKVT